MEKNKEYGKNMKSGWQAIITSGEKTSEIHLDIAKKLTEEPDSPIKTIDRYNKDNYRKRTIKKYKLKKTHEFQQDFINAQKHWADLQKELKAKEKDYEKAVKMNKDQKRELNRMNSFKNEIKKYEPIYVENLKTVFENTQNFELDRMKTFVNVFKKYHDVFSTCWSENRFKSILKSLLNSIDTIKPEQDLKKWSDNYGAGTKFDIV